MRLTPGWRPRTGGKGDDMLFSGKGEDSWYMFGDTYALHTRTY